MTLSLFERFNTLVDKLLPLGAKRARNSKMRRLVEEIKSVFLQLQAAKALDLHVFPYFYLLDKENVPKGRWATCKKDGSDQGEYLQRGICDITTLNHFKRPIEITKKSHAWSFYQKSKTNCKDAYLASQIRKEASDDFTEHYNRHFKAKFSQNGPKLSSLRHSQLQVKRGRPHKRTLAPAQGSTFSCEQDINEEIKTLYEEEQQNDVATFIEEELRWDIRRHEREVEQIEDEEARKEYMEELLERKRTLKRLRDQHIPKNLSKSRKPSKRKKTKKVVVTGSTLPDESSLDPESDVEEDSVDEKFDHECVFDLFGAPRNELPENVDEVLKIEVEDIKTERVPENFELYSFEQVSSICDVERGAVYVLSSNEAETKSKLFERTGLCLAWITKSANSAENIIATLLQIEPQVGMNCGKLNKTEILVNVHLDDIKFKIGKLHYGALTTEEHLIECYALHCESDSDDEIIEDF